MSRVAKKAAGKFAKIATLSKVKGPEAVSARAELKRMRDVWYSTDAKPSAGTAWNPKGKQHAKGSEGKARNIQRGHNARKSQGL